MPYSYQLILQVRKQRPPEGQPLPEAPRRGSKESNSGLTVAHLHFPKPFSLLHPTYLCEPGGP